MKCTDRDILIMLKAFDETHKQVNEMILHYRKMLIETTKEANFKDFKDFKDDLFFKDLGKEGVLFKMNSIYNEEINMRNLLNDANDIIEG